MSEILGLATPLCDPQDAKIDVILVHGLGGDRVKTWTWQEGERKVFWPKDLLPQACPTARILSFGYNADFAHFFPFYGPKFIAEQQTINDHSTALLQSIIGLREETQTSDRPIIFIAHSLGGLVCANALSRHHGIDGPSGTLADRTVGIIFLGTPFEGSSKAKWGKRGLQMLDWMSTTHKEDVKDLEERSAKLIDIYEAFQKFLKLRDRSETRNFVEIACFFEQYAMYKGRVKIGVIVPKESASLPGIDPQSIQANHVDMCKFEDEDREGYKNISQKLSQWIRDLDRPSQVSANDDKGYSVRMGDVNYNDKVDNKGGVVAGNIFGSSPGAVNITGTTNNYNSAKSTGSAVEEQRPGQVMY